MTSDEDDHEQIDPESLELECYMMRHRSTIGSTDKKTGMPSRQITLEFFSWFEHFVVQVAND